MTRTNTVIISLLQIANYLLHFRCGVKKKSKCSTGNEKHDIEDIDEILTHNQILLKDWQTLATSEVW